MVEVDSFSNSRSNLRWYHIVIPAIVLGVVGTIAYAARTALIAEENLQAFFHANRATREFIQENNGDWPRSWNDLRKIRPESDFDWVNEHLAFDFNADPRKIVSQTPASFTAIEPGSPCYNCDDRVQLLIDILKKYHEPY